MTSQALSPERSEAKQFCRNCAEPHWLWEDDPKRYQPCYVEDFYEGDDGNHYSGATTLRHRWPVDVCPSDCKYRRYHG
jgi:hypothetical protein